MTRRIAEARAGLTLVEVIVAVTILGSATLAMGAFLTRFAASVSAARTRDTAAQIAVERIEEVKGAATYDTIPILYPEAGAAVSGYPDFTRTTRIRRIGGGTGDLVDYRVITVEVTSPQLRTRLRRSTVIAAF